MSPWRAVAATTGTPWPIGLAGGAGGGPPRAREGPPARRDQLLEAVALHAVAVHAAHHPEQHLRGDARVDAPDVARRHGALERVLHQARQRLAVAQPRARLPAAPVL